MIERAERAERAEKTKIDGGVAYGELDLTIRGVIDGEVDRDRGYLTLIVGSQRRLQVGWRKLPPGRRKLICDAHLRGRFAGDASAAWRQFLTSQRITPRGDLGRVVSLPSSMWALVAAFLARGTRYASEKRSKLPRIPPIPCLVRTCRKTFRYECALDKRIRACRSCAQHYGVCEICGGVAEKSWLWGGGCQRCFDGFSDNSDYDDGGDSDYDYDYEHWLNADLN